MQLKTRYICPFCHLAHNTSTFKCPKKHEYVPAVFRMHGRKLEGKYEIDTIIAEGGMGIIYEANQIAMGRRVAVKFLYTGENLSEKVIARFQREARLAASITHRNIIEVYDMGTTKDKIPYIVMEFLEGNSLDDIIELGSLPRSMTIDTAIEILSGLNAVHSKEIIHRDLKPENIYLMEQSGGEQIVKILDFGISYLSRTAEEELQSTMKSGMVEGTPRYMAPEQVTGDRSIDIRTDLYSVGLILYEMATGGFPYEASNVNELFHRIIHQEPIPPHVQNPAVLGSFEDLILKALAKNPDDRFINAAEFAAHLSLFQTMYDDEGIPSLITQLPPELLKNIRNNGAYRSADTPAEEISINDILMGEVSAETMQFSNPSFQPSSSPSLEAPSEGRASTDHVVHMERRFLKKISLIFMALFLVALSAGGFAFFELLRTKRQIDTVTPVQASGRAPESQPGKLQELKLWKVSVSGIPENAIIHVDDILHVEHPIILEDTNKPRLFRIEAPGYEPWERLVAVVADIKLSVRLVTAAVDPVKTCPALE